MKYSVRRHSKIFLIAVGANKTFFFDRNNTKLAFLIFLNVDLDADIKMCWQWKYKWYISFIHLFSSRVVLVDIYLHNNNNNLKIPWKNNDITVYKNTYTDLHNFLDDTLNYIQIFSVIGSLLFYKDTILPTSSKSTINIIIYSYRMVNNIPTPG